MPEADPKPPRRRPRIRWGSLLFLLVLLVALAVTMAGIFPFRQIIGQTRAVELTQEKYDALASENTRLADEIALLETSAEVERIAREDFGLIRPGEIAYAVEWRQLDEAPAPEPSLPPPDERSWYEKMWDFVTGTEFQPDE